MPRANADFVKLKPPNQPVMMTPDQVQEFIRCARDPIYFMESFLFVQHPTKVVD